MNIKANALYSDLQSMAMQARNVGNMGDVAGNLTGDINAVKNTSQVDFSGMLKNAIDGVNAIGKNAGALKTAVDMGDRNVSMAEAMIASQKAGVAFEATVQVRNKLLEAYKEIMSMPV
jgi:flagellar hook-basal body complex protein FliE